MGGIQIAVGKLALYTAGGGIDPRRCIAVSLDVGTDNEQLLQDPFYLGNRHARRRGDDYDAFIGRYIETAHRLFPHAILHFEDFGPVNARAILQTYGDDYCIFNDDIQGTGAVVVAAVYGGCHVTGVALRDQKTIVFGAGTAGIGVADQIRDAMIADGATVEQATSQIWPIDRQGLLFDDMDDLRGFQVPYAKNRDHLGVPAGERVELVDAIKLASPTILLGSSAVFGAFDQEVIEAMAASCERPMIFPLSNPTSRMEAMPADVPAWSHGKALITRHPGRPPSPTTGPPTPSARPTTCWCSRASDWAPSSPDPWSSPRACCRRRRKLLCGGQARKKWATHCCRMCRTCETSRWRSLRPSITPPPTTG